MLISAGGRLTYSTETSKAGVGPNICSRPPKPRREALPFKGGKKSSAYSRTGKGRQDGYPFSETVGHENHTGHILAGPANLRQTVQA